MQFVRLDPKVAPTSLIHYKNMALMLHQWACIERVRSHSGRRSIVSKLLNEQGGLLATLQTICGHADASTIVIYYVLPENKVRYVLKKVGKSFESN